MCYTSGTCMLVSGLFLWYVLSDIFWILSNTFPYNLSNRFHLFTSAEMPESDFFQRKKNIRSIYKVNSLLEQA